MVQSMNQKKQRCWTSNECIEMNRDRDVKVVDKPLRNLWKPINHLEWFYFAKISIFWIMFFVHRNIDKMIFRKNRCLSIFWYNRYSLASSNDKTWKYPSNLHRVHGISIDYDCVYDFYVRVVKDCEKQFLRSFTTRAL